MATLADRAVEIGLTSTDWFDVSQGHPGVEKHATINPRANDWQSRYGTNGSMIEYNPRNWAGAHAPVGNIDAPIVYVEVFKQLGKPIEKTSNDLSDLDLIDGLTRYVMDQAARLRITADSVLNQNNSVPSFPPPNPPVAPIDPNPQPVTDPPVPDPSVSSLKAEVADLSQKLALAQSSLRKVNSQLDSANMLAGKLIQVAKVINSIDIPERGGGWPTNTLRKIAAIIDK